MKELLGVVEYESCTGLFYWVGGSVADSVTLRGYRVIKFKGKVYRQHRLAWFFTFGKEPKGTIDHINGNKLDNRILNLRDVTQAENCKNRKSDKRNSSGFRGVYKTKHGFISRISVNSKFINLGTFATVEDAALERLEAELEYGFHKNHGRTV